MVFDTLNREVAPCGFARWVEPKGGYFVSFFTMPGTAKRALKLCAEAGVTMTGAGAAFPYGVDPEDSNIRIAPQLPPRSRNCSRLWIFSAHLRQAGGCRKLLRN